jgi:hypothetical protein
MPYRHAHWYLLTLFPLVGLAFWPTYFSTFSAASVPLHAHAAAGTLWIGILAVQSWLIHQGRRGMHRELGIASLAIFPFFIATSATVVVLMAEEFASRSSPVSLVYGPRLGLGSIGLAGGFAYCYWQALRQRRKVHPHSRYMLSTVLFLGPPIAVRLCRFVPLLQIRGSQDLWKLAVNIQLANILVAAFAFLMAWRSGRHWRPFAEAGAVVLVNDLILQTAGMTVPWQEIFASLANVPLAAAGFAGGAVGILIACAGWVAGWQPEPAAGAMPA